MSVRGYPIDVSDEEWEFAKPYLCLLSEDVPQRRHDLREVFNALRYVVGSGCPWFWLPLVLVALGSGCPWRFLPNDFPRWMTFPAGKLSTNRRSDG